MTPMSSFSAPAKKKVEYINITYETKDNFIIKSKLFYPTTNEKVYPVAIFLHSLGYSSDYWGNLTKKFVDAGIAAIVIDLRGHGESVYNSDFKIQSWIYYTEKNYAKYPEDIAEFLQYIATNYNDISTTNYTFVGADVGANTAILTAEKMNLKPQCLVLMSPSENFKGLYTPISLAKIGPVPTLAVVSQNDRYFVNEAVKLTPFAQGEYTIKKYPVGGTGMMMLKVNPNMADDIVNWVKSYLIGQTTPEKIQEKEKTQK